MRPSVRLGSRDPSRAANDSAWLSSASARGASALVPALAQHDRSETSTAAGGKRALAPLCAREFCESNSRTCRQCQRLCGSRSRFRAHHWASSSTLSLPLALGRTAGEYSDQRAGSAAAAVLPLAPGATCCPSALCSRRPNGAERFFGCGTQRLRDQFVTLRQISLRCRHNRLGDQFVDNRRMRMVGAKQFCFCWLGGVRMAVHYTACANGGECYGQSAEGVRRTRSIRQMPHCTRPAVR